jgi:colanic acid/amylovoran biosynthesis glycosyltransferase
MRIAFFVGSFPLISETFISRQIIGLIDLGHEVDIFAEKKPPEDMPIHSEVTKYDLLARTKYIDTPAASNYWEMPVLPITGQTWLPGYEKPEQNLNRILQALPTILKCAVRSPKLTADVLNSSKYGYQALSLSSLYRLSKLCDQSKKYDVLHAHFGPTANSFRFARELFKAPLIASFHGYDVCVTPHKNGFQVYQNLFNIVDAVTVNSQYARQRLEDLGCAKEKIFQLNYLVRLNDFIYKERTVAPGETVRILTIGRLVEKKGIEYSIRAFAIAQKNYPRIRYDIIGEGPLRSKLEETIKKLRLEKSVYLHGALTGESVRKMLSEAHLFILSSITASNHDQEGTPVSLIEAQASGLPVLSTLHSGIPEVVLDGKSGFLVPEADDDALSERLSYLLEHPQLWSEMGSKGRKHVENYHDIDKLNIQLISLYEKLKRDTLPL